MCIMGEAAESKKEKKKKNHTGIKFIINRANQVKPSCKINTNKEVRTEQLLRTHHESCTALFRK